MARSDIFTAVFLFFNHLKLKVDYMQEFTFTVFVTREPRFVQSSNKLGHNYFSDPQTREAK